MSDRKAKLKSVGRSASTDSTDYSITMGKSVREKRKKPKERWLLTRKTWRYMADAGRKLIPDNASNRPEDIPKIEAYFQEVCRKEPKFLLWRKNSYPGALGLKKKKKDWRKVQSCRNAVSANDVDAIKPERPKDLAIYNISGGRFDIRKMRQDFMNSPPSPSSHLPFIPEQKVPSSESLSEQSEDISKNDEKLINMLEKFLTLDDKPKSNPRFQADFNYQELVEKLQRHLTLVSRNVPSSSSRLHIRPGSVQFEGDHREKSLTETLSRYFSQSTNRDKVISDLLTNRKALEKLYFELRKTKGFRGRSGGSPYSSTSQLNDRDRSYSSSNLKHIENNREKERERRIGITQPPPVIEIVQETPEIKQVDLGIQTLPIPEVVLTKCEEEYKKELAARKEEEKTLSPRSTTRRRSSVDNDDISQSVSDTIKRYLRMARKKSVDSDKADRFKRVNYDRNLRNIKAKGEITKPGDDDGLSKGCQTNEDWILTYRDLKFREISDDSRVSSSRSSVDAGGDDKSPTTSPPHTKTHHSFLSHFLPSKNHDKHEKSSAAVPTGASAMQKSKSSSSVMHHGSRLVAKKIFRTRSKSQSRAAQPHCNWMPQGSCVWTSVSGRQVILSDSSLLQLSEIERKVLQKVAIAKLQALNLGVNIKVPTETAASAVPKKRRPHLLKRKAITTSIFDSSRKDGDKDGSAPSGLVFGIPLTQCVENDRISRAAAGTTRYKGCDAGEGGRLGRRGSRASFSSLIDAHREGSSCESLMGQERMAGSVPGLLDKISCSSTADLPDRMAAEGEELTIPQILTACIKHIEKNGLHTLGIFRVSTSKKRIRELRESFDSGRETTLDQDQCPHDVATLLKEYLRELPDPLLCRDLYHAFVQTQRIRNRRLQFEALQHLIQILPSANRDTLHALLNFLSLVAQNSTDTTDELGELVQGNKMDSNNLATVFAPNILHCIKANSSKDTADRAEDRIDIINVVRTLIDHHDDLFRVSAELLDEVYVHMMDSHPEALDELLSKRDITTGAEESQEELDSESYSAPWSPTLPGCDMSVETMIQSSEELPNTPTEKKRMWSREECLHEAAATGGPNISMRIRHKDKIRERSQRRKREESASRKRSSDDSGIGGFSSAINIISKLRGQREEDYQYGKNRSSSLESSSSTHTDADFHRVQNIPGGILERRKSSPFVMDNAGVITASLTIPVQTQASQGLSYNFDDDIPFIEDADNGRQQLTIGVIKTPTVPPRRRQRSISGSDSSVGSTIQPITGCISLVQSTDSAVGSPVNYSSPIQNTPTSFSSSIADAGMFSSPPSWTSSPPTSPDSAHTSVNYIPDDNQVPKTRTHRIVSKDSPTLQKVTFIPIQEVQKTKLQEIRSSELGGNQIFSRDNQDLGSTSRNVKDCMRTTRDVQDSACSSRDNQEIQRIQGSLTKEFVQKTVQISSDICKSTSSPAFDPRESREPRYTPSISNIGNAVLKSKTADFEKIAKTEAKPTKIVTTTTTTSLAEKKKYTKRRYTDTRHPTRHIPDSESLEFSNSKQEDRNSSQSSQQVYKRRELISSVQTK
ncbi:uncharacterized protein LOC123309170 [Coccinella septempunctata]|uniref:uncharacterized protein LOC123309170 n=1 Tax=Coccinella septempunctata TaxID=41139 RepID=UPI001D07CCD9|nr:uncharacterized protein LOC123309170 [Coccinella septempunctata]